MYLGLGSIKKKIASYHKPKLVCKENNLCAGGSVACRSGLYLQCVFMHPGTYTGVLPMCTFNT